MPIDIDPQEEEMFDVRKLRESGDSVVLTITPDVLRKSNFSAGDEVRVATPFDGGEITVKPAEDEVEGDDRSVDEAEA